MYTKGRALLPTDLPVISVINPCRNQWQCLDIIVSVVKYAKREGLGLQIVSEDESSGYVSTPANRVNCAVYT